MKQFKMRPVIMLAMVLTMTLAAQAQQKGSIYIGGSLGYNTNGEEDKTGDNTTWKMTSSSWNFSPEVGYFVSQTLSVGLMLDIGSSKNVYETPGGTTTKTTVTRNYTGFGVNARKYFPMGERFSLFAGVDVNMQPGKRETEIESTLGPPSTTENKSSSMGANLNGGLAFNVTDKLIIFGKWGALGFSSTKDETGTGTTKETTTTSDFGLNVNSTGNPFNVGIYFMLR